MLPQAAGFDDGDPVYDDGSDDDESSGALSTWAEDDAIETFAEERPAEAGFCHKQHGEQTVGMVRSALLGCS